MYLDRVLLPASSNREDFLLTVGIFDDDTGEPIDLSGRTLANPGSFTGSAWTVTDGAIVTSSITQLTIPDYPIGNQLTAVALKVGLGLGMLPGDPITIADPTGKNTMFGFVTSYAPATGALVCQIGFVFAFEIRRGSDHWNQEYGFSNSYYDCFGTGSSIIVAALGTGINIVDTGVVQILIPATLTRQLHRRAYSVGMGMTDSINTRQILIGELPILFGELMTIPPVLSINLPGAHGLP